MTLAAPIDAHLGVNRLPGRLPVHHLPPVGEHLDEQESATALVERARGSRTTGLRRIRRPGTRIGHLDADAGGKAGERQLEVPPRHAAVRHGVGGELADDQREGVGDVRR